MTHLVVDAHVHVWGAELLDVPWLRDPAAAVLRREFGLGELRSVLDGAEVDRVVLIAADESLAGTRLLLERAAGNPLVGAVVGWVDLAAFPTSADLDSARSLPGGELLRGIRQPTAGHGDDWWTALALSDATAELERAGLVLELLAPARDLPRVAALAAARPGLRIVVDHLGHPPGPDDARWLRGLAALAPLERVALKVSGVSFDDAAFDRAVEHARSILGAERLMAGSDWPVVLTRTDPAAEWSRMRRLADSWSTAERARLLGGTAACFYGIAA